LKKPAASVLRVENRAVRGKFDVLHHAGLYRPGIQAMSETEEIGEFLKDRFVSEEETGGREREREREREGAGRAGEKGRKKFIDGPASK